MYVTYIIYKIIHHIHIHLWPKMMMKIIMIVTFNPEILTLEKKYLRRTCTYFAVASLESEQSDSLDEHNQVKRLSQMIDCHILSVFSSPARGFVSRLWLAGDAETDLSSVGPSLWEQVLIVCVEVFTAPSRSSSNPCQMRISKCPSFRVRCLKRKKVNYNWTLL